jgi:precorrin-2 dehydrogenase/sirohydrochlorin ferrochelatase
MSVEERNNLYPIFLKVHVLNVLIIGGGEVGLEKLGFLLKSSPNATVHVVALRFKDALKELAAKHQVVLIAEAYHSRFLENQHLVIAATDDVVINRQIYTDAKAQNTLVNVADTPDYCDFYLGGIVTKGHVKIAISTNGKSPTTAKRLRQYFEEVLPDNINEMVQNLNRYRNAIKGDFAEKVNRLNALTEELSYRVKN